MNIKKIVTGFIQILTCVTIITTCPFKTIASSGSANYSYLDDSDLISQLQMGDVVVSYSYEQNRNKIAKIQNKFKDKIISEYNYNYDNIGRMISVARTGSAFHDDSFILYFYNDRNELTGYSQYLGTNVNDTSNSVLIRNNSNQYDSIGNKLQSFESATISTYTTNNVNQYIQQITGPENKSFSYDMDGNLTIITDGSSGTEYIWNAENRLVSVIPLEPDESDKKLEFQYDYQGRRVQKLVFVYSAGSWRLEKEVLFVYDDWNLIEEITKQNGKKTSRYFVWGLDISRTPHGAGGIGGLLAVIDHSASQTYFVLYDANGNVGQLINSETGEIAAHYEYNSFGHITYSYGEYAEKNPFRWSTKYYDVETGLLYYGHRYYSLDLERWMNRDPIGETGGINLYVFVSNNPIDIVDLLGLYEIYLSFDDGPDYGTDDILDNLKTENTKATFFINLNRLDPDRWGSNRANWNLEQVQRIAKEGHLIGNHSYSHEYQYGNPEAMKKDFDKNVETLKNALGKHYNDNFALYGRLPGSNTWRVGDIKEDVETRGKSTEKTAELLNKSGYNFYGWDIEWHMVGKFGYELKESPKQMAEKIIEKLESSQTKKSCKIIMLAHDRSFRSSKGNGNKVSELIQQLKQKDKSITFHTLTHY